jgi:aryl-alcohol dehydrogenase-like predicted oxidoreductase
MITSLGRNAACPLGLAAGPQQDARCVRRAFDGGIDYFFFYGPGNEPFVKQLATLTRKNRDEVIIATGSGARKGKSLLTARRKIVAALNTEVIDVFFAEYVNKSDDPNLIFGDGGVLDQLQEWKAKGWIRYVGATTHDRELARWLAEDSRVDVLMHRYNMAHRKARREVFPTAIQSGTPVVAFTATRWGTLLKPPIGWPGEPPSAVDCYRYCLAQGAVHIVLSAPRSLVELDANLQVLRLPRMTDGQCAKWERYGDLVLGEGAHAFETRWP